MSYKCYDRGIFIHHVLYCTLATHDSSCTSLLAYLKVVMMSQEDQKKQTQQPWLSQLDRERRNLSASVEETLESAQEQDWDEEDEIPESPTDTTAPRQALIPPRLSLQSKSMPAVRPEQGTPGRNTEEIEPAHQASQQPAEEARRGGALSRFTHRLAAVFAPGTRSTPGTQSNSASPNVASSSSEEAKHMSRQRGNSLFGMGNWSDPLPDLPPPSPDEAQHLSRQRENSLLPPNLPEGSLAGQARPVPGVAPYDIPTQRLDPDRMPKPQQIHPQTAATSPEPGGGRDPRKEQSAWQIVSSSTPAVSSPIPNRANAGPVPVRTSTPRREAVADEQAAVRRRSPIQAGMDLHSAFGNGVFEEGQGDVFVKEPLVTERSVVMVTLTSNPGRVVAQYVSLTAGSGFTVHLTASVARKTTFNYVVLESGS